MADSDATKIPPIGLLAILGMGLLPGIAGATISIMLPAISDAFGNGSNNLQIKSVATAVGLGMMIGAPASGFVVDRIGRRPVLLLSSLIWGVFGCGIMLATDLWQIIVARFFIGVASGAIGVSMAAIIGDFFKGPAQSRWMGFSSGSGVLLLLLVLPLTGALTDMGWRYGFSIYAIAFPVLLMVYLGIPKRPADAAPVADGRLLPTMDEVPWRALMLAAFLGTLSMGTSLYWPFRLREVGVISGQDIALYSLPMMVMTGGAALGYGLFRRFLSVTAVFVIGTIVSAISLTAIAVAQGPSLILMGLTLEGLAIGMLTPNLTTYALMVSPEKARGRAMGLVKGALYGSPFVTQFALEPIAGISGTSGALLTIASMALLISVAVGFGALGLSNDNARRSPA